jgi:erythromycin esterase
MAIENVSRVLREHAPDASPGIEVWMACLARDANTPDGTWHGRYAEEAAAYQDACRADVGRVHETLASREAELTAVAGEAAFARALRSARVLVQYEAMATGNGSRDAFMAENALWLLDHLGPDARIVLWAHNGHVKRSEQRMGRYLADALGDDLVTLGFAFGGGSFNAVLWNGASYAGLRDHAVTEVPPGSYEAWFRSTGLPRFVLDLRERSRTEEDQAWLHGPRQLRSIGAAFDPRVPLSYFHDVMLTRDFDAIVWFEETRASRLLPFDPPASFHPSPFGAGWMARAGGG